MIGGEGPGPKLGEVPGDLLLQAGQLSPLLDHHNT